MRRPVAVVGAVVAVALLASSAAAQTDTRYGAWIHSVSEDDFTGRISRSAFTAGDELGLFVYCPTGDDYLLLIFMFDGTFRDGDIDLRWDEGEIESYAFEADGDSLSASTASIMDDYNPEVRPIVAKLMAHSELRVRVGRRPDTRVTDRISLNGSGRAIRALGCR